MRTSRLVPLLVLVTFVVLALQLGAGALAQGSGPRTLTFTELEKGSTFTHIRNTKSASQQSNLQGDVIAFTNPLADSAGRVTGKLHVSCTTTSGARDFLRSLMTCSGVIVLRDGVLTLQANVSPRASTTTGAITGGSGVYANARGTFVSKQAKGGSATTITLAG